MIYLFFFLGTDIKSSAQVMRSEIKRSALLGSSAEGAWLPADVPAATAGRAPEVTEGTHDDLQHGPDDVLPLHYGLEERKTDPQNCTTTLLTSTSRPPTEEELL